MILPQLSYRKTGNEWLVFGKLYSGLVKRRLFETKLNKHNSGYRQTGLYHEHFTLVFNGGECHIVDCKI